MVESIQTINVLLLNLIQIRMDTRMRTDCLNWPTIKSGKNIYHPILRQKEIITEQHTGQDPMWFGKVVYLDWAVTNTGKILSRTSGEDDQQGIKS